MTSRGPARLSSALLPLRPVEKLTYGNIISARLVTRADVSRLQVRLKPEHAQDPLPDLPGGYREFTVCIGILRLLHLSAIAGQVHPVVDDLLGQHLPVAHDSSCVVVTHQRRLAQAARSLRSRQHRVALHHLARLLRRPHLLPREKQLSITNSHGLILIFVFLAVVASPSQAHTS